MALSHPFLTYGTARLFTGAVAGGAAVTVQNTTTSSTILNTVTNGDGKYLIDIMSIGTAGHTIKVTGTYGEFYGEGTFVLDTSGPMALLDLSLLQSGGPIHINAMDLGTVVRMQKRTTADSWNVVQKPTRGIPYVGQTGQDATQLTLPFIFTGTSRYAEVNTLRDGIRDCEQILIRTTKYLYGTATELWLTQTNLDVSEAGGPSLSATLTGNIDPYMIHSCDFTSYWAVDTGMTLTNGVAHNGKYCITGTKTTPTPSTTYSITYQPVSVINLADKKNVGMWIKLNTSTYTTARIYLYTGSTHYGYATLSTLTADTWRWCSFNLATGFTAAPAGTFTQSSIAYISWSVATTSSPPATLVINIDNIRSA